MLIKPVGRRSLHRLLWPFFAKLNSTGSDLIFSNKLAKRAHKLLNPKSLVAANPSMPLSLS
jgi:hypothetical protein